MIRIAIDPNVRIEGNQTFSGLEDVEGGTGESELTEGAIVEVFEPESGLTGPASIVRVDTAKRLVYLQVEWKSLAIPAGV